MLILQKGRYLGTNFKIGSIPKVRTEETLSDASEAIASPDFDASPIKILALNFYEYLILIHSKVCKYYTTR